MSTHLVPLRDGRVVEIERRGKEGGEPVYYLHWIPGCGYEVIVGEDFAKKLDMELFGVSRPGIGQSTFCREWTARDCPKDLAQCADYFGHDRFSLLAQSGGSPCAVASAALLSYRVKMMTLVSGMAPIQKPGVLSRMRFFQRMFMTVAGRCPPCVTEYSVRRLQKKLMNGEDGPRSCIDEINAGMPPIDAKVSSRPEMRELQKRQLIDAVRQGTRGIVQDIINLALPWPVSAKCVTVPTDIWHGREDRTVPPLCATYLSRDMPHAEIILVPGQGHTLLVEKIGEILTEMQTKIRLGI